MTRGKVASHLVVRGVALEAVQERLGHATIDMTMRHAHLSPDVRRDAVRLLDVPAQVRGDMGEPEAAQRKTPRRTGGLDGAGKGI